MIFIEKDYTLTLNEHALSEKPNGTELINTIPGSNIIDKKNVHDI